MRRHTLTHLLLLLLPPLLMAACGAPSTEGPDLSKPGFVRGVATVVSVDPDLGRAVLQVGHTQILAYWQTEWASAQGGTTTHQNVNQVGVGVYVPPAVKQSTFDAHPGDRIAFIGMQTGSSIFLQGISVISP